MKLTLNGKSKWAMVRKPEMFEGKPTGFSIQVELAKDALERLKACLIEEFEEATTTGHLKDKKFNSTKYEIQLPIKEDSDGQELVKAKTKHFYIDKTTNQRVDKVLPIFDKYGKPMGENILIGNGSEVQVRCESRPYVVNGKTFGVALYMQAILVKDLVEYQAGGDASAYGFTFEESEDEDGMESYKEELLDETNDF